MTSGLYLAETCLLGVFNGLKVEINGREFVAVTVVHGKYCPWEISLGLVREYGLHQAALSEKQ